MPFRILIADDHSLVRSVLRTTLERHLDWQVCAEARNGLEAVQKAAEFKPDIIILDFAMPVMDGLQATRKILSLCPTTPILMFTNYCFPTLVQEAALAGVRQVVDKGLSGMELVSAVETVLGDKPRRAPVSA
jgi:DNA-binding NarL/FixJ family response regulator